MLRLGFYTKVIVCLSVYVQISPPFELWKLMILNSEYIGVDIQVIDRVGAHDFWTLCYKLKNL